MPYPSAPEEQCGSRSTHAFWFGFKTPKFTKNECSTATDMHNSSLPEALDKACREKRAEQRSKIPRDWIVDVPQSATNVLDVPRTCGVLDPSEVEITELDDVKELLNRLAKGTWSCVDVTRAYCKRAVIAHQLVSFQIRKMHT